MQKNDSYELDNDELVEDSAVSQSLLQRTAPELSLEIMTQNTSSASQSKEIQQQKLLIAELGQLQPIGFIRNGFEHNLLADGNTISTILETEDPASPVFHSVPKYHGHVEAASISEITLLPEHIAISPFQKLIANNYIEMNDELSVILNTDWNRYPWLQYVCARMMEGALFLDHGKEILVDCAETYGRTPENDAYHKKFKPTMTQIFPSSLPQPFTRYTNIEIKIIQNDNSSKLVLGPKTMNAPITSSIRIGTSLIATLGSSSSNGFESTLSTCIFITKQFIMWYQSMAFDVGYKQLYPFDEFAQLRQTSNFVDFGRL